MSVTLQDIADRCGVSRVTVSHVLRRPDNTRYAEETRKKIVAAARELGYVPNHVARNLKQGSTRLLGLVMPFNDPGIIDGIEQLAQARGYSTMIQFTPMPDPQTELRALRAAVERRVDGLIWQSAQPYAVSGAVLELLRRADMPVVLLQYPLDGAPHLDVVSFDWEDGLRQGIRHLQAAGYASVLHLLSENCYAPQARRADLFTHLAAEAGIPSRVLRGKLQDFTGVVRDYLREHPEPVGMFGQHWLALHARNAAESLGRAVPEEVGILMLGDMRFGGGFQVSEMSRPRLSTVDLSGPELAARAVEGMISRLRKKQADSERREYVIPARLRARESTRPEWSDLLSATDETPSGASAPAATPTPRVYT